MDMKYLIPALGVSFGVAYLDLVFNKKRKGNYFDVNSWEITIRMNGNQRIFFHHLTAYFQNDK